jgi:hypothetical protein
MKWPNLQKNNSKKFIGSASGLNIAARQFQYREVIVHNHKTTELTITLSKMTHKAFL